MVLQHANDGNLREYLKANFSTLQWTDKLRISEEISYGLLFLHENNIIHRDLVSILFLYYIMNFSCNNLIF